MSGGQGCTCSIQHGTPAPRPGPAPEGAEHTGGMTTAKNFRAQESVCRPSGALPGASLPGFQRGACLHLDGGASGLRAWDSGPQSSCSGLLQSRQLDSHGWTVQDGPPPGSFRPVVPAVFQRVRADQAGLCVCVCV